MPYQVEIKSAALRDLGKLPTPVKKRIASRIDALADNPFPPGARKLSGGDALYRIRVGDYRVIYQVQEDVLIVLVVRIGHRKDAYR